MKFKAHSCICMSGTQTAVYACLGREGGGNSGENQNLSTHVAVGTLVASR